MEKVKRTPASLKKMVETFAWKYCTAAATMTAR